MIRDLLFIASLFVFAWFFSHHAIEWMINGDQIIKEILG